MSATQRATLKAQLNAKGIAYPLDVTTPELEKLVAMTPTLRVKPKPGDMQP